MMSLSINHNYNIRRISLLMFLFILSQPLTSQTSSRELYNQAVESVKNKHYEKALKYINTALKKEPKNDLYLAYQSHIFRLTGHFTLGQTAAEKAVSLNDRVAWYHVSGALNSYHSGDWTVCKNFLKKLMKFSQTDIGKENIVSIMVSVNLCPLD